MGLLLFKERTPNDRSPYRKNEFHVGVSSQSGASNKSLGLATSDARTNTRSPIRRDISRRDRTRLRRMQRSSALESFIEWLPTSRTYRDQTVNQGTSSDIDQLAQRTIHTTRTPMLMEGQDSSRRQDGGEDQDFPRRMEDDNDDVEYDTIHADLSQGPFHATRRPILVEDQEPLRRQDDDDENDTNNTIRAISTSAIFPPARQFYEALQREQRFDVMRARAHVHTTNSLPGSPEPVASPATQHAILQQIENQSDLARISRLYADGTAEIPATAPRMRLSRSDGLGDRRRSPSNDDDRPSSAEENWNSLMTTIPVVDDNLPSASSSFASDSASSILSRSYPRPSLTNTSMTSRSDSAEAATYRSLHCPETNDSSQPTSQRMHNNPSPLVPLQIPSISLQAQRSRSTTGLPLEDSYQRNPLNAIPSYSLNPEVDSLHWMTMLDDGMEVPAEMWAGIGISPHLGLRDGAGRSRRRNERL